MSKPEKQVLLLWLIAVALATAALFVFLGTPATPDGCGEAVGRILAHTGLAAFATWVLARRKLPAWSWLKVTLVYVAAIVVFGLITALGSARATEPGSTIAKLAPDWRISRVVKAPWSDADARRSPLHAWVGRRETFHHDSVDGPGVLNCGHAEFESTRYPAAGLFQGNLPAPAADSARELGITDTPVDGVSLNCDTGLFEFHRVEPDALLLALDNHMFTLSHTPGTLAPADSPEGRVQQFLEAHFSGDMSFTLINATAHRAWFSARLQTAMSGYFAKPASPDEVPAIDGVPFTDTQEYPARFAVGKARIVNANAEVPVTFSDAGNEHSVVYLLRKEHGAWLLGDLRFSNGDMLLALLQ